MRCYDVPKNDQAVKEDMLSKRMKRWQVAILLVGAAHGVLSGQLAAGWLDLSSPKKRRVCQKWTAETRTARMIEERRRELGFRLEGR